MPAIVPPEAKAGAYIDRQLATPAPGSPPPALERLEPVLCAFFLNAIFRPGSLQPGPAAAGRRRRHGRCRTGRHRGRTQVPDAAEEQPVERAVDGWQAALRHAHVLRSGHGRHPRQSHPRRCGWPGQSIDSTGCESRLMRRVVCLAVACVLAACVPAAVGEGRLSGSYGSPGVTRVILRAAAADTTNAELTRAGVPITVSGRATGGAEGYHPADPKWRETSVAEWGLDFVASRFGATLIISSKNEFGYIHHHYVIDDIVLQLPPSVELVRQARTLSGSGEPDLMPP